MTVQGQTPVTYTYDNADRLTQITQGSATVTLAYDNANRRTSLTLPNGIVTEYAYDAASRLTGLTYKLSGTPIGTLTYSYDAAGNRTVVGGTWARTGLPAALTSATYNAANQQTAFDGTTQTFDLNGNLTSDGALTYTWDARNRLASLSGSATASFQYDPLGRRTSKTINSTQTGFLHDALNPVQELNGSTPTANLLTGLGIDEYLTRTDSTATRAYLTEALGSTVALTDDTGTVQASYTYEPFGATAVTGTSTGNSFDFTGRESDGALKYYRARYYHPQQQRFISEDPIEFGAGDVNLYSYVFNAPVDETDPTGEIAPIVAAAVACGAGAVGGAAVALSGRKPTLGQVAAGVGVGCAGGLVVLGGVAIAGGVAAAATVEKGAEFLLANWYRSTFFSTSGTVFYHWTRHAQRYGKTAVQYTRDAVETQTA